ncbi:MAG: complex I NDUFA9 subunit family protein [Pseudomonadota bacterium]
MQEKTICLFGGSGFIGRRICQELAAQGHSIRIATRDPKNAQSIDAHGSVDKINIVECEYDEVSIQQAIQGCDIVINLVGILYEKGQNTFQRIHTDLPEKIAKACKTQKIKTFIHLSALGIDISESQYAASKLSGEKALLKEFPKAVILRPSIVFGSDDNFFNMFADLSKLLPALPLIGGGKTKFQPVYVGDIADAITNIISQKDVQLSDVEGQVFELGGPDVESFKQLFDRLLEETNRRRFLMPLPFPVAKIQAMVMSLAPKPLLTPDQVASLKSDNIVSKSSKTLNNLGVAPTSMDKILPTYLGSHKKAS